MSLETKQPWPLVATTAEGYREATPPTEMTIEGRIPESVAGDYLFNGPGCFRKGGIGYQHWLDGDGRIGCLRIRDGQAVFAARFVESQKHTDERTAKRPLYRGFGTRFADDRLVRGVATATPVNVSVYGFGEWLLAFGEQGLPYLLDSETLETKQAWTFDGRLTEITPFTGHPKVDPHNGDLLAFGVSFSTRHPSITYYRFHRDGALATRSRVPLPGPYAIHDFAVSRDHVAFHVSPYTMDIEALRNGATVLGASHWPTDGARPDSRVMILDRETGSLRSDLPIGFGYCLHLANAFEEGGEVVVDLLEMPRPIYDDYVLDRLMRAAPVARPVRLRVDLEAQVVLRQELSSDRHGDFPNIDRRAFGRPTDCFWFNAISPAAQERPRPLYDQLCRADWATRRLETLWQAPEGGLIAGEPAFVADGLDPSRGTLILPFHQPLEDRWGFALFDAFEPGPPVARLWAREPIHLGFHSTFRSSV